MKKSLSCVVFIFYFCLHASEAGFEIKNMNILKNNKPDSSTMIFPEFYASVFLNFNFEFQNQSLNFQPGFFIENKNFRPFFRQLNYSAFTDYLFFEAGKDNIYFGEGYSTNYFFLHIPYEEKNNLWHIKFDIPVKQIGINFGFAADSKNIDLFKIPGWYSFWFKTEYSTDIIFAGIETDLLFMPDIKTYEQKKEAIFKAASELSFSLPYDFKLYSNAAVPVNIFTGKIKDWGILTGMSKFFLIHGSNFLLAVESSYSNNGLGYGFFYNYALKDAVQFTSALHGLENKDLNLSFKAEVFISSFKLSFSYITKNFLTKNNKFDGVFILEATLNN